MDRALEHFRDELGLPRTSRLRAEPHSMLVYGKGQFFLPHQDSEKHDDMVGTLVVSLPSAHTGGELVIDHAGESTTYRASNEELTFVAFYADCRHQVTPVKSGYRTTLTFNLLADAETPAADAGPTAELAHCLTEHFTTPATMRYGSRDLDPPNRLVFLLDHEYTQRGLNWRRLKGADAERAALLRAAAELAGCETVLALAEVKETWDAEPSDGDRWDDYYDGLAAAAGRYGEDWTRNVIDGWFGPGHHYGTDLSKWVGNRLPELCGALRAAGTPAVARLLAARAWSWLGDQLRLWTTMARSEDRQPQLEKLSSPLVRLLEAADDTLCDEITGALREYGDTVLECLMPALHLADERKAVGLDAIARDCADRLGGIIARPPRAEDDWSIEWTGCRCDLCDTLGTFLGSRSQRIFEWPLAKTGRQHVHTRIDSAALPVRHQTRRQGRPYTLVLTKTDQLFTRGTNARHKAVTDLAWLTSTRGDASART